MFGLTAIFRHRPSARPLFVSLFLLLATATSTAQPSTPTTLVPDQAIVRTLAGGATHTFQIALRADQYLCVSVEQRGIDIELKLSAPQQQMLVAMDTLNGTQGAEVAAVIAAQAGLHQIEIVSPSKSAPAGSYEIKILALRPATEPDRRWLTAQRFYTEGKLLSEGTTAAAQEQAAQKLAEALRLWQVLDDRLMVAHTLYYLVSVYRDLGQTQHALVYSGYALELLRANGQRREEAPALTTLAIILNELGELPKALEYYEQSLTMWRAYQDTYGEARTLINLGLVNSQLGEPQTALQYYNQALAVWHKLGERFQAAETLSRIGRAYYRLSEWQKALEYAAQAQTLYRALENKRGEATVLNNIGLVYERLGEAGKALTYFNQALSLWRTLGNRREEAETLGNIGQAQAQQKNAASALASYQLALKLWREAGDRRSEALVLQRLGELQASAKDAPAALEFYQQALLLLRTAGDSLQEANVRLSIGELQLAQNAPQAAQENWQQALAILQTIGNQADEAKALYGLARAARERGNLVEAQHQIEAALAKAEAARINVGSQQLRASYLASVHPLYECNVDILMRLHAIHPHDGYDARAVQASERARARSLLELLTEARANLRPNGDQAVDKTLLEQSDKLRQQLNAKAQRQMQLATQRSNAAQLQTLKQEISALEDEYNQVETRLRQSHPHYAALTQPQPLSLAAMQQQLEPHSLLLTYALGEERSWLWAVTKTSRASFPLPARAPIEQAVQQLRAALLARNQPQRGETNRQRAARLAQADLQYADVAAALSQMLLQPVAHLLENQQLIIVADGALQYVPFGALPVVSSQLSVAGKDSVANRPPTTDNRSPTTNNRPPTTDNRPPTTDRRPPLILHHELITLPSVSTLAVLRAESATRQPAPKTLAVFADPVFTPDEARQRSRGRGKTEVAATPARSIVHENATAAPPTPAIPRLPFTRQEAEQILAFVPKSESFQALDFAANRAAALHPSLGQYRYLHFATHGLLDNERPGLSALVLSLVNEQGQAQDGFLRAHEIYRLRLPAELVVLSACQTGLGQEVKGEGLIGLTRGFMYAGAARVVVSLWSVNDKATAELMTRMYQKLLQEGQRPAAALRAAQVEMWQQKQWQAPYYWAAFVLQGEGK